MKTPKQLERHFKGAANHWRIAILRAVKKRGALTTEDITEEVRGHYKTVSQHTHTLVRSGLLNKTPVGRSVTHHLSPYGKKFITFFEPLEYSNILENVRMICKSNKWDDIYKEVRMVH